LLFIARILNFRLIGDSKLFTKVIGNSSFVEVIVNLVLVILSLLRSWVMDLSKSLIRSCSLFFSISGFN